MTSRRLIARASLGRLVTRQRLPLTSRRSLQQHTQPMMPPSHPVPAAWMSRGTKPGDADECLADEPVVECIVRKQVDGPWADAWAKYVLLRPGMSFRELKAATLQRNKLDPKDRIPGTYRTVVLTHAVCFVAAIPALLSSDAVFPRLVEMAAASRAGVV